LKNFDKIFVLLTKHDQKAKKVICVKNPVDILLNYNFGKVWRNYEHRREKKRWRKKWPKKISMEKYEKFLRK